LPCFFLAQAGKVGWRAYGDRQPDVDILGGERGHSAGVPAPAELARLRPPPPHCRHTLHNRGRGGRLCPRQQPRLVVKSQEVMYEV
jgi:hypothetical protein